MSAPTQQSAQVYTQGTGTASLASFGGIPYVTDVAPGPNNISGPSGPFKVGQAWIDTAANAMYILTSLSASQGAITGNWEVSASSSTLATLSGDTGGDISPTGGNIDIAGTANQITTTGSGSTITLSIPTTFTGPGAITATTNLIAATGNVVSATGSLVAADDLNLTGAGSKILINVATPSSASAGFFTLTGSTPFVLTSSAITPSSILLFTLQALGTVSTASTITYVVTAGEASLTISAPTDTSTYGYLIIN